MEVQEVSLYAYRNLSSLIWQLAICNFKPAPLGLVIFLKHQYGIKAMKETEGGVIIGDTVDHSPLFRGKDAIIYQILKQMEFEVHPRFVVEQLKIDLYREVNAISGYQKADCWIGDSATTTKANLFTPNVVFLKASPLQCSWDQFDPETTHDGEMLKSACYGNGDCGNDFYYRHTSLIVKLPGLKRRRWLRRKEVLLLAYAKQEPRNILCAMRTECVQVFRQMIVDYFP